MTSGGGQVRQRPNGLWEGRYFAAGGRRHSIYGKTMREALEKMRTALTAADNGLRPIRDRGTVEAFLADWLESTAPTSDRERSSPTPRRVAST